MRIRHRIPSIFNLSMVDVLCCALGCVPLLWLVNLRQAREEKDRSGITQQELETAQVQLATLEKEAASLKTKLDDARRSESATFEQLMALAAEAGEIRALLHKAEQQWDSARA